MTIEVAYQASLFDAAPATSIDAGFSGCERIALDDRAWIDLVPGWIQGAEPLFAHLLRSVCWAQRTRRIFDQDVIEPRMTARWTSASGDSLAPSILDEMRRALQRRYGVVFDSAGFNLYRDGNDGVAWHRDKIRTEIVEPTVPLISLGEPRKLLFRPRGGGPSRAFALGHGDLLVTGGTAQRTWEHAVPKVARAGARISVAFRHGLDPRRYGEAERA